MKAFVDTWFETPVRRLVSAVFCTCAVLCCYFVINSSFEPKVDLLLPIDTQIPFLPWTIFIYQSLYVMVLLAAYVTKPRECFELFAGMVVISVCSYVCFYFWTAHYPRPATSVIDSLFLRNLYGSMHAMDGPGNTFPSIHASSAIYVGWHMRRLRGGWGWPCWGVVVALSTLTVKQHFVVDVIAGGVLAALVLSLVSWRRRRGFD